MSVDRNQWAHEWLGAAYAPAAGANLPWMLDAGEELVARVLGHECHAAEDRCSCGWLAGEADHRSFTRHARAAIKKAERELPKKYRPRPPALEAKRQRDEERREWLERLNRRL